MKSRPLLIVSAVVLLILGLAGLVLPGIQGIALLVAGILLLGQVIPSVRRWQLQWEKRSPTVAKLVARFRTPDGELRIGRLLITIVIASVAWALLAYGLVWVYHQL